MSATNQYADKRLRRWAWGIALGLAVVLLPGCDSLLDVELPDAVTEEALDNPATADLQVLSVAAMFECAYGSFVLDAGGYEDNFQRIAGSGTAYSEYRETPAGGNCSPGGYSSSWVDPLLVARGLGYRVYDRVTGWTQEQIGNDADREELLGTAAIYNAAILTMFGEFFCEFAIDSGELMTPDQTLATAEEWATTALGHISTAGDYPVQFGSDGGATVAPSAEQMAYGIRARARWAQGDLAGAASDAAQVDDGFYAYVLRESAERRYNQVVSTQLGLDVAAAGFLQGPVRLFTEDVDYGVTALGENPVTGQPWPDVLPFTGYIDLGIIEASGRAVDEDGFPITTADAGAVEDTRVPIDPDGNVSSGARPVPLKYLSQADDIPLVSWAEMRLIRAEAEGGQAAIDHVDAVRNGMVYVGGQLQSIDLPSPTYADPGDAEEIENMIIEERRRALWLEGRYWSTKIQNVDKLWFPRAVGDWINSAASYVLNGGVRVLMPQEEYTLNLGLEARGTGCPAEEAPVFN